MTTIDFNQLMRDAGEGFQPVPDGPYHVEVSKSEPTTTSAETGHKPMIRMQLRILGGPHAGRILFDNHVLSAESPGALGFFFDNMEALGLPRSFFSSNPPWEQVASSLLGRQALVTVGMGKPYKGKVRNEIQAYAPAPVGQIAVASGVGVPAFGPGVAPPAMPQSPAAVPPPMPAAPPVPSAPTPPAPAAQPPVPVIPPMPAAAVPPPMPVAPPMSVAPPVQVPVPPDIAATQNQFAGAPAEATPQFTPEQIAAMQAQLAAQQAPAPAPVPAAPVIPPMPVPPPAYNPADEEPY